MTSDVAQGHAAPEVRPDDAVAPVHHLTLVVYPFHSFVALNEFQAAVHRLRGVRSTRVRRFYRGTLYLAVDDEDITPLSERLLALDEFRFQVISESPQEVELRLDESKPLTATGDR